MRYSFTKDKKTTIVNRLSNQIGTDPLLTSASLSIKDIDPIAWILVVKKVTNPLETFGKYLSIIIGFYTIIEFAKRVITYLLGIVMLKKSQTSTKGLIHFMLSPMTFMLG